MDTNNFEYRMLKNIVLNKLEDINTNEVEDIKVILSFLEWCEADLFGFEYYLATDGFNEFKNCLIENVNSFKDLTEIRIGNLYTDNYFVNDNILWFKDSFGIHILSFESFVKDFKYYVETDCYTLKGLKELNKRLNEYYFI